MNIGNTVHKRAAALLAAITVVISCLFTTGGANKIDYDDSGVLDTGEKLMSAALFTPTSDLGGAQGYNLVCFDSYINGGSDVEGKSAIGGQIDVNGEFAFGSRLNRDDDALVWGGTDFSDFHIERGSSNATALIYEPTYDDFKSYPFTFSKYVTWTDSGDLKDQCGFTFSELQSQMCDLSDYISGITCNCGTPEKEDDAHQLIFTAPDPVSNVFTISSEQLSQYSEIVLDVKYISSTVIINVTGENVTIPLVRLSSRNVTGSSDPVLVSHLLWNLSSAQTVTNYCSAGKNYSIEGSVLAPNAEFQASSENNFEGTMIVSSFNSDCKFECHNYPFQGSIPSDPHESAQLSADKTAKVNDWDERTYDIDLSVTAKSNIQTNQVPCDVILVLDRSGSMKEPYCTSYTAISGSPDPEQSYYILVNGDYVPLTYNNGWHYQNKNIVYKVGGTGESGYVSVPSNSISEYKNYYILYKDGKYHSAYYYSGFYEYEWYGIPYYKWYDGWVCEIGSQLVQINKSNYTFYNLVYYDQFYSQQNISKLDALKSAAKNFVDSVESNSPESRVGVVSFAGTEDWVSENDASIDTVGGLLSVENQKSEINAAIDGIQAGGGTHSEVGMKKARDIFDGDKMSPLGRYRAVIMFTDGEPGNYGFDDYFGYKEAASTINQAYILKAKYKTDAFSNTAFGTDGRKRPIYGNPVSGKGCGATVYTIGIFSNLASDRLKLVNQYMTSVASCVNKESKYYSVNGASTSLNDIFQTISKEVGGISCATVTDVIDPRFKLMEESYADLTAHGAAITENSANGTQTVKWFDQPIQVNKDPTTGELLVGWTRTFTIVAKDDFIGGNAIATNGPGSGVTYGTSQYVSFRQPEVNVKAELLANSADVIIFSGEEVPLQQAESCKGWHDSNVNYQWFQENGNPLVEKNIDFPKGLTPDNDTSYTLKASFDPGDPTEESTENTDGHVAGETDEHPGVKGMVEASGTYAVKVVKGELDITKIMDQQYPAPVSVNARQSFVFKITRSDTKGGAPAETFYEVITPDTPEAKATKTITGLKKGFYEIAEETGKGSASWRYSQEYRIDNDVTANAGGYTSTADDGTVYIGRETTAGGAKSYFGAQVRNGYVEDCPATVHFKNDLQNEYWLGDTTAAVNTVAQ